MSLIMRNVSVAIQTALAAAKTITGISKAAEAVVTATHDFSIGDYILIESVVGMTQINNRVVRVKSVTGTASFVCEGLNSQGWTTWGSGGTAKKITFGAAFGNVTSIDLPDATPDEIDVTTIHDDERQIDFGHDSAQKGTLSIIADAFDPGVVEVNKASAAKERRAFLVSLQNGYKALFNAYCSGGSGFSGGVGAVANGQIALTLRNRSQWFAN